MSITMLSTAATGIKAGQETLENIGNNIANIGSRSFKRMTATSKDNFYHSGRSSSSSAQGSGSNISPIQIGTGCQVVSVSTDFSKGHKEETGRASDLYLDGRGYFKVRDSISSVNYASRSGDFKIDDRKFFVTTEGYRLQAYMHAQNAMPTYRATVDNGMLVYQKVDPLDANAQGSITDVVMDYSLSTANNRLVNDTGNAFTDEQINAQAPTVKSYNIDQTGNISFVMTDDNIVTIGQILLMDFNDEQALTKEGKALYSNFAAAGPMPFDLAHSKPGSGRLAKVHAGALESSNVDLTQELTSMMNEQKRVQACARVFATANEISEEVVNLKR